MAVLIEKRWEYGKEEGARVTAAVLPSGRVLAAEDEDVSTIEGYVKYFGPEGLNVGEKQLFENIADIHKTPLLADFWIIEDPQEARKIIQEAGLK